MDHKIFVTVQGGVAEVCEDTVLRGVVVEVLDFDNLEADPLEEILLVTRSAPILAEEPRRLGTLRD